MGMPEVEAKRKQQAKAEEDDGPTWSNDYIDSLGKNMTEAIGQAQESREIVANITGEDLPPKAEEDSASGASGASPSAAEEMRFLRVHNMEAPANASDSKIAKLEAMVKAMAAKLGLSGGNATSPSNASAGNSSVAGGASGAEDLGEPRAVTHSFTRNGETVTTNTVFHAGSKQKKNALWEKIKEMEEKKKAGPTEEGSDAASGESGASGVSGESGADGGKDKISRLASVENVIYGQVNAARKKEVKDEKIKSALLKKINKLEAELSAARKPKDPVSAVRKIHMIASGNMEKSRSKVSLSDEVREAAEGALDPEDAVSLKAIALKLEGGASSGASGPDASGPGGIDEDASGSSGPSDQEQLNGIVSRLNSLPGQETKMIAKLASQLGEVLASPSGSEALGPEAQKRDRGGDKAMEKADFQGLESIAKKLANLLGEGSESGSSGASGPAESDASGSADEDDLDSDDSSGASGAEEEDGAVNAAEDEMLKKRVKVLEEQLEAIGGEDGSASMAAEDGEGASDGSGSKPEKEEDEATISSDESGASGPTNGETPAPKVKPTQKGHEKDGFKKVDQVGRGDLDNMINHFFRKNADGEIDASGAGPLRGGSSQDVSPKIVPKLSGKGAPPAVQVVAKTLA